MLFDNGPAPWTLWPRLLKGFGRLRLYATSRVNPPANTGDTLLIEEQNGIFAVVTQRDYEASLVLFNIQIAQCVDKVARSAHAGLHVHIPVKRTMIFTASLLHLPERFPRQWLTGNDQMLEKLTEEYPHQWVCGKIAIPFVTSDDYGWQIGFFDPIEFEEAERSLRRSALGTKGERQ